jgi:hypothetical protein
MDTNPQTTIMDLAPVPFINPITGKLEIMPVEMINAYLPMQDGLRIEEAAKLAAVRDHEAAINLMLSVIDPVGEILAHPEGLPVDEIAIEPAVMA